VSFKTVPYRHQLVAYEKLKNEKFFALFMDMGLGKSKTAIDIAVHKYEKGQIDAVLVIAPNMVHAQWADEQIPTHCSVPFSTFVWTASKANRRQYQFQMENFMMEERKLKFFMVNVETFQSESVIPHIIEYVKNNEVFTIVDESTRIKTPTAKRTKTITKLNKYGQRCILSGTPVAKSPFDLYAPFNFLSKDFFQVNYFIFKHRFGVMMKGTNEYTGRPFTKLIDEKKFSIVKGRIENLKADRRMTTMNMEYELTSADLEILSAVTSISEKNIKFIDKHDEYTRFKRLDELRDAIDPYTFSVKKGDLHQFDHESFDHLGVPALPKFPDKVYVCEYVQMSKEQKKIYGDLKKHLLAEYSGHELSVQQKVSLSIRLRQVTGGYFPYEEESEKMLNYKKVPFMKKQSEMIGKKNVKMERIHELLEEMGDESIIIWASFVAEIEAIYEELKKSYSCELYYGATSKKERARIKDDFMAKKFQIFIGNPSVAGFGLNLQVSTIQLWYSNSYRTEDRLQAEDRSHRIGTTQNIVYKDIIAKGTLDEKIYKAIREGRNLNDYFSQTSLEEMLDGEN